ncbi:MAG: GH3 auxin-responsive promoter family protein [Clostridiales Family XIII bacterium]|nr:GH3 auxin-responsive promoter family protein [Clostridiales Family XIII bacterium]
MYRKLEKIISSNQHTAYGERYAFCDIKNIAEFQKKVPITVYEDYIPYIEKIKKGEQNVLTAEPVLLLEPSSGSTSTKKLIPYTKGLKREFSSAIGKWLLDLNKHFPRLKYGQVYFSITPQAACNDGIVGFNRDDEYIGGRLGRIVANKFCVPDSVKNIADMEEFWLATVEYIKRAKNLRFVSIWNPTFLLIMLEKAKMPAKELFPQLEVISCWADGNSKPLAERLQKDFPDVYIQPKGLLATEGIMTIPIEDIGKRLTNSHFFEFVDKNGDVRLKDELDIGEEYEIIITTSGGFYRYNMGDIVQYNGNYCFDFIGRSGNISDYFGEKLNEVHVRNIIAGDGFRLLVPTGNRYTLYSETNLDIDKIDEALRENFHYDYCRELGQLEKAELVIIQNGEQQYIDNCLNFGMRLGDIKPTCLSNRQGWVFK